ncbi:NifB/NifX family molybdenum-iron cluster-binding protein [Desulfovibrio inopinatus]|uniref:NifB/NifX family molybdenum-iron cluster-binding protein n=1 Tax=Desulfovibrio inopinatus TaxID=102109 RepID=UPI0004195909|nr:NifB/NifX family molybdenum-iron cluster-binding protein [Desulfovibrio inopinatus]
MNIAVFVDGETLSSPVSEQLERCKNLLVVNVDTMDVKIIPNKDTKPEPAGINLAKAVLKHNCEAIITGKIRTRTFDIIANACVTRYNGFGHDARTALELMDNRGLDLIRDPNGGGCSGSHHDHDHDGECSGSHHDHGQQYLQ